MFPDSDPPNVVAHLPPGQPGYWVLGVVHDQVQSQPQDDDEGYIVDKKRKLMKVTHGFTLINEKCQ